MDMVHPINQSFCDLIRRYPTNVKRWLEFPQATSFFILIEGQGQGPAGALEALSTGAPKVNANEEAAKLGPAVTFTSSDTPVILTVPPPVSASAVTVILAVPVATVLTTPLIPSAAGATTRTVSSLEA
jgi:hypothetical protein